MTRILILEKEIPALALLRQELEAPGEELPVEVVAAFGSISESATWFRNGGRPDIVLCALDLSDGHAFHLFTQVSVPAPVIFLTGFDQLVLQSLEHNGIPYLLKPATGAELRAALHRALSNERDPFQRPMHRRLRKRLVVQRGLEQVALAVSDIALFYTENKMVFVLDCHGQKYICDEPLQNLEADLDPSVFFRANRQFLINIEYIQSFRSVEKSRLKVQMDPLPKGADIIVSQETASRFRRWIEA
jgi:DNA-binding LytR/AlgR family response regulator